MRSGVEYVGMMAGCGLLRTLYLGRYYHQSLTNITHTYLTT